MAGAQPKSTKPRVRDSFVALQVPEFRRFFAAALVSGSGSWLQALASPFVMYEITESAEWVGFAVFSGLLPMALVGPFAGPLADRMSRRRILLTTQCMLVVNAMVYALLWWGGVREPVPYIVTGAVYGTINGFNMPAWQAYVSDLVPRSMLMNAITLNSAQFNAARAIGPMIGGVVLAFLGPGWSFTGNAMSFLFVIAALVTLPDKVPVHAGDSSESPLRQFASGWRYARNHEGIRNIYLTVIFLAACGATLAQVHLVLFAEEVFEVGSFQFGLLVASFGMGAIFATPVLTTVGTRFRRSQLIAGGLFVYGFGEIILALAPVYVIGMIGTFIAGACHLTTATSTNSTLQMQVAESMRGRVLGLYLMVLTVTMPVAAGIQGVLDERFGPQPVVFTMGCILIVASLVLRATGRIATADRESDELTATEPQQEGALPEPTYQGTQHRRPSPSQHRT